MKDTITVTRWKQGTSNTLILAGTAEQTREEARTYFEPSEEIEGVTCEMSREEFDELEEFEG